MAAPSAKGDWARSAGSNLGEVADWDGSDRNNPPKWRNRESRFINNSVVSPSPLFTYNPQRDPSCKRFFVNKQTQKVLQKTGQDNGGTNSCGGSGHEFRQLLRGEASQQQTWQVMRNNGWNPGIAGHMTTTPAIRAPCSERAKGELKPYGWNVVPAVNEPTEMDRLQGQVIMTGFQDDVSALRKAQAKREHTLFRHCPDIRGDELKLCKADFDKVMTQKSRILQDLADCKDNSRAVEMMRMVAQGRGGRAPFMDRLRRIESTYDAKYAAFHAEF